MQNTTAFTIEFVALITSGWGIWLWRKQRIAFLELLLLVSSVVATLGSLHLIDLYMLLKPLPMSIAIVFVATSRAAASPRFNALLIAALLFSLGGDVFLMLPGDFFIPGLASFLVAHVFYIALFRQGQAWFPSKKALACVLAVGALMYGIVWPGLGDPVLKGAVAAYVTVISLMVSQAIGRATVLGSAASRWVAAGTCIFMASDSLIAISKFVTPIALESLWVLITYFAAQMLIVHFSREASASTQT